MTKYNGHKNWNHWNVSLWLNNDESLYKLMERMIRCSVNREHAAKRMQQELHYMGMSHTPDGAPYSKSAIRFAMIGV